MKSFRSSPDGSQGCTELTCPYHGPANLAAREAAKQIHFQAPLFADDGQPYEDDERDIEHSDDEWFPPEPYDVQRDDTPANYGLID